MIDWATAERVAAMVAGTPPSGRLAADVSRLAADSQRRVIAYTDLHPTGALPPPEVVDRQEWIRANLADLRPLLEPLASRMGDGMGALGAPLRLATGLLVAAEVGGLTGLLAQRVLGQYELMLLDPSAPTRLLLVGPNLQEAARSLDVDRGELVTWVAFHEITHAVQFSAVPWLRGHLAGILRELLDGLEVRVDPRAMLRLPDAQDLRRLVASLREGDLVGMVIGPERRQQVDRLQATMAVVEGYAEHVMDAVGAEVLPSLASLRAALDRRRHSRPAPWRLLERLLGIELKLRQYEIGKRFCDAVVQQAGLESLNRVWSSAEALPTLDELEDPAAWLTRTNVPAVTK